MIKICIDNIIYPSQTVGGISNVFYQITKRLLNDNRFIPTFVDRTDSCKNLFRRKLQIKDEQVVMRSKMPYLLDCFINPKPGLTEPYIFHSSYYRISRDKAAKIITTVHDFAYERVFKHDIKYYAHIWQQEYAVRKSDAVICISQNTKKDLLHYYSGIDESKIYVIYNGVSEVFERFDDISKSQLPFEPYSYCLFVGGRSHYKNFGLAVEALSKTPYKLVIIGTPLAETEKQTLDMKLGREKYVVMSNISDARLNDLYNGAFSLLYLSSYEGFGIPCIEAQRAGCPVIAYNSSSIPEVMCDEGLLINSLTTMQVVEKLKLLENSKFRGDIVNKGIIFSKKFTWGRCYQELTDVYLDVMNR